MNRKIRFKLWDTKRKEMITWDNPKFAIGLDGDVSQLIFHNENSDTDCDCIEWEGTYYSDHMKLLQYTGLKDIHGKHIYEGDILNVSKEYSGNYIPVYVLFDKGAFKVQVVHKLRPAFDLYENISVYEIIGNIYEDEQLLNEFK